MKVYMYMYMCILMGSRVHYGIVKGCLAGTFCFLP